MHHAHSIGDNGGHGSTALSRDMQRAKCESSGVSQVPLSSPTLIVS